MLFILIFVSQFDYNISTAAMAELADALDLGSSGVTRTGSIPASCTIFINISTQSRYFLYREQYLSNI